MFMFGNQSIAPIFPDIQSLFQIMNQVMGISRELMFKNDEIIL